MKCHICNGEIHDIGIRVVLPELKWHGKTLRGKEVCMCIDCATIFYDNVDALHIFQTGGMPTELAPINSTFEFKPSTIPTYTLSDRRANIIKRDYKGDIIE